MTLEYWTKVPSKRQIKSWAGALLPYVLFIALLAWALTIPRHTASSSDVRGYGRERRTK